VYDDDDDDDDDDVDVEICRISTFDVGGHPERGRNRIDGRRRRLNGLKEHIDKDIVLCFVCVEEG
jgi:hypothetical protein